jgi:hypothetical protein
MSNHAFVHVEFPTTDPAQSAQFYSGLFGWEMNHMPEFDYWTFSSGERQGGGFNKIGNGEGGFQVKAGEVLVYVQTDDIERDLAKAEQLGGSVVSPKQEIPGIGWYGVFRDPVGNQVGLYTGLGQTS